MSADFPPDTSQFDDPRFATPPCAHAWVGRKTAAGAEWWECPTCGARFGLAPA